MKILIATVFLVVSTLCAEQDPIKRQIASQFNNRASEISQDGILRNDQSSIQTAIQLLDSAIAIDSSYTFAYTNKASLLCHLARKYEAIQTLETMLDHSPTFGDGYQLLGMIYEFIEMKQKAVDSYRQSIKIYEEQMVENPEVALTGIITGLWLLEDGQSVDSLLTVFNERFSKSMHFQNLSEMFRNADRLEFVNSFCK